MSQLWIGNTPDGKPFYLPADLGDKKIALLAQSKKGKTYGLGCILEEMVKAHRPFIATDPADNLYGLRVLPDGSPSGLSVVIIGGPHADIPFVKDQGERMAEALLASPICAVIDTAFESNGAVRKFWTDFAARLMRSKPEIARVIVLEEGQVLIPQNAVGIQARVCKDAVASVATIGGNFNYGVIVACQRAATLDKNVLSQCEGLIVMGMTHKKDRDTVREWMESKDIDESANAAFQELGALKPGDAWYWNPSDEIFQKFTFRKRETLHPREMQKLGLKAAQIQLGDVQAFVEKVKKELTKTSAPVPSKLVTAAEDIVEVAKNPKLKKILQQANAGVDRAIGDMQARLKEEQDKISRLVLDNAKLRTELKAEQAKVAQMALTLHSVKKHLQPQYDVLKKLFSGEGASASPASSHDPGAYASWMAKAGRMGCKRMLEILIQRGQCTRNQLGTLASVASTKSTFRNYLSWLKSNGLVAVEGDMVRLLPV